MEFGDGLAGQELAKCKSALVETRAAQRESAIVIGLGEETRLSN